MTMPIRIFSRHVDIEAGMAMVLDGAHIQAPAGQLLYNPADDGRLSRIVPTHERNRGAIQKLVHDSAFLLR
jgi:hypothetical protein